MSNKQNLKIMVRGAYDLQKMRIMMGNRIVGQFKSKLGQEPGKKESEIGEPEKKIINDLRARYRKITDGVKTFPRQSTFVGDEIISTYTELCLLENYVGLEEMETRHFRRLESVLRDFQIYTQFLKNVKGIGPAMAGVIVSEMDPADRPVKNQAGEIVTDVNGNPKTRPTYASSFWQYSGLNTVSRFVCWERFNDDAPEYLHNRHPGGYVTKGPDRVHGDLTFDLFDADESQLLGRYKLDEEWSEHGRATSRKSEHLVDVKYTDKNGDLKTKKSITFNPFLKTKLVGVLGSSFLRAGENPYRTIYDQYKAKLKQRPDCADLSDGHIHNRAIRYMIKQFLVDLYSEWRRIEGLTVYRPYDEGKLGSGD